VLKNVLLLKKECETCKKTGEKCELITVPELCNKVKLMLQAMKAQTWRRGTAPLFL
jgi:hypothetical protein